jgi:choline monooxygenase
MSNVFGFDPTIPLEKAWTPPSAWYLDRELFELERRRVFQRCWQPVVRVADLPEPGDYVAGCFAAMPWVVVRAEDGEVRAFHNVCRHKGREVVTGAGNAELLVCGYHAWAYRLDGSLRRAPRMAGIEDFDVADMALTPLAAEVWGPWVWINGSGGPTPLRDELAELGTMFEARRWERLELAATKSWDIGCNWKVYVDNYLDGGYHIPHMHPSLDAQLDMDSYRTELFGRFSVQTSGSGEGVDRIGEGAIYAWLYPNFMINVYGDCMDTNRVIAVGPDRCRVEYEFWFAPEVDEDFRVASIEQADVTQREDIEICESVQIGLQSPAYDRGRYAPRVEHGEHHFHQLHAEALRTG